MEANEVCVGMNVSYKDASNRDKMGQVVKVMDFGVCVRAGGKRVYLQANALTPVQVVTEPTSEEPAAPGAEEQQHASDPEQTEEAEDGHVTLTLTEEQSRVLEAAGLLRTTQQVEAPAAGGSPSQPEAGDERPEGTRRDVQALEHEEAPAESPSADEPQAERLEAVLEERADEMVEEQQETEPRVAFFDVRALRWCAYCTHPDRGCFIPVHVLEIRVDGTALVSSGASENFRVDLGALM